MAGGCSPPAEILVGLRVPGIRTRGLSSYVSEPCRTPFFTHKDPHSQRLVYTPSSAAWVPVCRRPVRVQTHSELEGRVQVGGPCAEAHAFPLGCSLAFSSRL